MNEKKYKSIRKQNLQTLPWVDEVVIFNQETPKEIFEFCKKYNSFPNRKPLVAVPSSYSQTSEKELEDNGVNIVIYANASQTPHNTRCCHFSGRVDNLPNKPESSS